MSKSLFRFCGIVFLFLAKPAFGADADPLYYQAEEHLRNQRFDSAIDCFTRIISIYPMKKEGYFNRGLAYYHSSRLDEAIADFNICLKMDSFFRDAQYMKAITLEKKGQFDEAIAEFEQLGTYKESDKRIKNYRFSVYLSENWYYMIAILLLVIILLAIVAKTMSYREW